MRSGPGRARCWRACGLACAAALASAGAAAGAGGAPPDGGDPQWPALLNTALGGLLGTVLGAAVTGLFGLRQQGRQRKFEQRSLRAGLRGEIEAGLERLRKIKEKESSQERILIGITLELPSWFYRQNIQRLGIIGPAATEVVAYHSLAWAAKRVAEQGIALDDEHGQRNRSQDIDSTDVRISKAGYLEHHIGDLLKGYLNDLLKHAEEAVHSLGDPRARDRTETGRASSP